MPQPDPDQEPDESASLPPAPVSHLRPVPEALAGAYPDLSGRYRLRVEVPLEDGSTAEATSSVFEVTAP